MAPLQRCVPSPGGSEFFHQDRYSTLACNVLARGMYHSMAKSQGTFWTRIVPQLLQSVPAVKAAAAAFGASYETTMLQESAAYENLERVHQYSRALHLLQTQLQGNQHGVLPQMTACVLLAFADTLRLRNNTALMHLRGAYALMSRLSAADDIDEDILLLFRKLDLHSVTYSTGLEPSLYLPCRAMGNVTTTRSIDHSLFEQLHGTYRFISSACDYRYVNQRQVPTHLRIEQLRYVAIWHSWLSSPELQYPLATWEGGCVSVVSVPILRAQCLTALILVSTVLDPYQAAYDKYAEKFHEIVMLSELVVASEEENWNAHPDTLPSFTPEPGLSHPLFVTATKYRHPQWRRRAVKVLSRLSREGPWCGEVDARIVLRLIDVEEGLCGMGAVNNKEGTQLGATAVPERMRIHSCRLNGIVDARGRDLGKHASSMNRRYAEVRLSRCHDVEELLAFRDGGHSAVTMQTGRHWNTWTEEVPLC
ncbi:hypothetical protein PCL_11354 [Purpureocillium lilacinum]|uniref:Uncharacterized protein n=1 Tax=Purpureocillium lilacinum TaxID=33203 RepID=A0A2U3DPR1_PURLI|nr:hypothetical protein PCL_11354 [Purpureocillium lilacinum]